MAVELAQVIIKYVYGEEEQKLQSPLTATLDGGVWTIVGSRVAAGEGHGPVVIKLSQVDARLIDLEKRYIVPLPPELPQTDKS